MEHSTASPGLKNSSAAFDLPTATPDLIPPPLIAQLKLGGRMVIPIGIPDKQQLLLVEKAESGKLVTKDILPVQFSPLEESGDLARTLSS